MIRTDRKLVAAVLKLTDNYHDELTVGHNPPSLLRLRSISEVDASVPLNISEEDAMESVNRLMDSGLLCKKTKWMGGFSFSMTSQLKHRHAFWWDSFSKRFIAGFISGFLATVASGVALHFITGLF